MARVLILRDRAAGARIAAALEARGHRPILLPVQDVGPLDPPLEIDRPAALILTSRNAVPFAQARFGGTQPTILAVGPGTAEALRQCGFDDVRAGAGQAVDLVDAAEALTREAGRPLLYLAGRVRRPDLELALGERNVPFETVEVYDTQPLYPTGDEVAAAIGEPAPDAVLLLSAGQAEGLGRLVEVRPEAFSPMPRLLCLSDRIRAALPEALVAFAIVSDRPGLSALLEAFEHPPVFEPTD